MLLLDKHIQKQGYSTLNILYPSRQYSLEELSEFVHQQIQAHEKTQKISTLHFVTHSMGGLIARYYIHKYKPKNIGKVVMLSPPNKGSEIADFLTKNKLLSPLYKITFGPAGQQLTTAYKHLNKEEKIGYPLGIIAGNKSINPLAFLALNGEHDGIVPVERMKIDGMQDFITLPVNHTLMMFNKHVMEQVTQFLSHTQFKHPKAA